MWSTRFVPNAKKHFGNEPCFYAYYRMLNCLVATPLPKMRVNFSLLDRAALDHVVAIADYDRYFPGLRHWVGFQQQGIPVERRARHDQYPRVSLRQLFCVGQKRIVRLFASFPCRCSMPLLRSRYWFSGVQWLRPVSSPGHSLGGTRMDVDHHDRVNVRCAERTGNQFLGEYVVRIYDQVRQRPPLWWHAIQRPIDGGWIGRPCSAMLEESDLASALQDQVAQIALDLHIRSKDFHQPSYGTDHDIDALQRMVIA